MDYRDFDHLVRSLATRVSRRSVLRRAVGSAITSPLTFVGITTAHAQGKDKGKEKAKGNQGNQGNQAGPGASGCRPTGHPCVGEGNQTCCDPYCWVTGPGNVPRCTNQPPPQGAVQPDQPAVQTTISTLYWVDVSCTYDAPHYRTVCDCLAHSDPGAPAVHTITLPPADICAVVLAEEMHPAGELPSAGTTAATGGEANAGTGGVANAEASGGSVTVGDVRGDDTTIAIDASGGTANADASGGDSNVASAGGGQSGNAAAQMGELSRLTLTLEGNVVPGKTTTYWVETDAGRRPAPGAALVQVDDTLADAGVIIAEARTCPIGEAQPGYDWFGQCTTPAVDMPFSLYPASGDAGPLATLTTNAQGRAHFGALQPGTYHLQPEGTIWCYAESDHVDANGNIIVEAGLESHVWSFVCGGPGRS